MLLPYLEIMTIYFWKKLNFVFLIKNFCDVEATSGDSGNHKLLNSEDKLLYQTGKKERIANIAVNHTNGDIAIVVGKYLKDGETQKFHVVLLAKSGDKYTKVKTQKVKLNSVNSVWWKDDEQIIITNDAGKEVIRK